MYHFGETLLDKLRASDFAYTEEQKLFIKIVIIDTEFVCVAYEKFKNEEHTTGIGKYPIFRFNFLNLFKDLIFFCKTLPYCLSVFIPWCYRVSMPAK